MIVTWLIVGLTFLSVAGNMIAWAAEELSLPWWVFAVTLSIVGLIATWFNRDSFILRRYVNDKLVATGLFNNPTLAQSPRKKNRRMGRAQWRPSTRSIIRSIVENLVLGTVFLVCVETSGLRVSGDTILPQYSNGNALVLFFVVYFVWVLVKSVPKAVSGDPILPSVKITIAELPNAEAICGKLLHHTEGTWHFFDEHWKLKAIPDGEVKVAEIFESSDQQPVAKES